MRQRVDDFRVSDFGIDASSLDSALCIIAVEL
jgi:hypothetical protein